MAEIKIKETSLPRRCEVCHQRDCYNPLSNYCSRCKTIVPTVKLNPPTTAQRGPSFRDYLSALWNMSRYFKVVILIPSLYILTYFFDMLFDGRLQNYQLWKINPLWALITLFYSFFYQFAQSQFQAEDKEFKAMKNFRLSVIYQTVFWALWSIYIYYSFWPDSYNPDHPYFTPIVWILNVIVPLLYVILVLFIPDKKFITFNKKRA